MTDKIRVLIAEANEMVRFGIRNALARQPDIAVSGEAAEDVEVVNKLHRLQPDIVLLDMALPLCGGLETLRRIRESGSPARVIFLSIYKKEGYVWQAVREGARGYVLKPALTPDIVDAIRIVYNNGYFFSHRLDSEFIRSVVRQKEAGEISCDSLFRVSSGETPADHPV